MLIIHLFILPAILLMYFYFVFVDFNIFVFLSLLVSLFELNSYPQIRMSPICENYYIIRSNNTIKPINQIKPIKPIFKDFDIYLKESINGI